MEGQYVCLSYATLFSRPVVAEMFRELVEECGLYHKGSAISKLDDLLSKALHGILSGICQIGIFERWHSSCEARICAFVLGCKDVFIGEMCLTCCVLILLEIVANAQCARDATRCR